MCNLDVVSDKRDMGWASSMVNYAEGTNFIGQFILIWSVVDGGCHFSRDEKKFT